MTAEGGAFSVASVRRTLARNGVAVLVGTKAAANILRLISNLILTRLLAPEAFGVVGIVTAIGVILTMITDMGFNPFIVRSRTGTDQKFLDVVWTVRLFRNAVLTLLMLIFAGAFASAFGKPELKTPIMAAAFIPLIDGLRSMFLITAQRARRVAFISVVELAVAVFQIAVTIAAVFYLRTFWGIIVGMYAGSLCYVALSYGLFSGARHHVAFDRKIGADLWRFARVVVVSSTITVILGQADKVFIGRALSLDQLGLYMLAVAVTAAANNLISPYVNRVLFPIYAQAERDAPASLPSVYYDARRRMVLILAFLLGGGIGGGPLLVRILFNDHYLGAGVFVSLLCIGPLLRLINHPAEQVLIVLGKIRATLEANIVRLAWIVVAAPLGYSLFGVLGLVAAFATIELPAAAYWVTRLQGARLLAWQEEAAVIGVAGLGAGLGYTAYRIAEYAISAGIVPPF